MNRIRNLALLEGRPKICVPVFGKTADEIRKSAESARQVSYDLIEWRMDYLEDLETWPSVLRMLRQVFPDAPLLATLRTREEGGQAEMDDASYFSLLRRLVQSHEADAVDVEYFHTVSFRRELMKEAAEAGVAVIVSVHDFERTPERGDMEALLEAMAETGGIPKLAVMPHSFEDVLSLLGAAAAVKDRYPKTPLIAMGMGDVGVITRVCGEFSGSRVTFGTAAASSAPGQLPAGTLAMIIEALHREPVVKDSDEFASDPS